MTKFLNISTDTTLGGSSASDEVVSSQKALKTYIDAHSGGSVTLPDIAQAGDGIDFTEKTIIVPDYTQPNYTVFGSPTINDGIAGGFSTSNYLKMPSAFQPSSNPWQGVFKLKTPNSLGVSLIVGGSSSWFTAFSIEINNLNSNWVFDVPFWKNTTEAIVVAWGQTPLQTNTWYWLKFEFTGTEYNLYLSTDGITYNLESTTISSDPIYQPNDLLKIGMKTTDSRVWNGLIDLSECYIKVGSSLWWTPYVSTSETKTEVSADSTIQRTLVSGTNIKTINNQSVLGSGNITIGGSVDIDGKSITTNSSDEIQTVGVIDQNATTTAIKTWTGTKAQYDALVLAGTIDANTLYNITDDTNPTQELLEAIYPVGSIYIGTMNVCPLSALFGTWTLVSSGRVLQGADANHSAGTTIGAGLPNINASLKYVCANSTQDTDDNAFYFETVESGVNKNTTGGGNERMYNVYLDTSRSSSIYGNSTTVQPPAYVVNIWQRSA